MTRKRYKSLIGAYLQRKSGMAMLALGALLFAGIAVTYPTHSAHAANIDPSLTYVQLGIGAPRGIGDDGTTAPNSTLLNGQVLAPTEEDLAVAKHYYVPVTVTLTQTGEYHVSIKAENNPSLLATNTSGDPILNSQGTQASIPTLGNNVTATLSDLKDAWGFRAKEVTEEELNTGITENTFKDENSAELFFRGMPASSDNPAKVLEGGNVGNDIKHLILDFGAGVTGTMPSGRYGTKVVVTAVAKPQTVANIPFYAISTMQEMTSDVCASVLPPNNTTQTTATFSQYVRTISSNGTVDVIPETILTDERDGKTYVVRKMPDGNCWMAQNLDLDIMVSGTNVGYKDANSQLQPFTPANTDVASTYTLPAGSQAYSTQTTTGTLWHQYGCAGDGSAWTDTGDHKYDVTTWCSDGYELRSYDPGDKCWTYSNLDGSENDVAGCAANTRDTSHIGNYYNWSAATLGTGIYSSNVNGENVDASICPANWKLPTGSQKNNTAGQLAMLFSHVSGVGLITGTNGKFMYDEEANTIMGELVNPPYSLVRSGNYSAVGGILTRVGTYAYSWSRTAESYASAYTLTVHSTLVTPGTGLNIKGYGFPARCVVANPRTITFNANGGQFPSGVQTQITGATFTMPDNNFPIQAGKKFIGWSENPDATLPDRNYTPGQTASPTQDVTLYAAWSSIAFADNTAMQALDKNVCESAAANTVHTLVDTRDGKKYLVKKMADGHCWMYQNLALQTSTWVYPFDTNVSTKWQLPTSSDNSFTNDTAHQTTAAQMNNGSHKDGQTDNTNGNTGAYYNWPAATATTSASAGDTGDAASDICPKGWRLPNSADAGNTKNEFEQITKTFGGSTGNLSGTNRTNFMTAWLGGTNNSSVLVGRFNTNSGVQNSGSGASWWSRTAYIATNAYYMDVNTSGVYPASSSNRCYGFSVRCILVGQ